ncbi:MAG: DUF4962 domain-containing protein [Thermoflexales bacterium]|nr:DUF4962 domain-containing protein [Thermoflexales bacterium]
MKMQRVCTWVLTLALVTSSMPRHAASTREMPGNQPSMAVQQANLVAYYPFDGDAHDASGNGHDGVVQGAALTSGKEGQAYQFDGIDDMISVAWDAPIQGEDQSFTLAAWVKTDDVSGEHWVLADDAGWAHLLFGLHRGNLYIRWRYGSAWTDYTLNTYQSMAGDFTHVAATYDASSRHVRLYINGALAVADTTRHPLGIRDASTLHIGKGRTADPSEYFNGVIDDVRIYDGALSDDELRALAGDALVPLTLHGSVADQTIYLSWAINASLPPTSTWQIAYEGPAGSSPSPVTGIISATRSYTLTGMTNDTAYTITLNALAGGTPALTGTLSVTPTTAPQHPRLFFSGREMLDLRQAGRTTHSEIGQPILEYATSLLGSPPPTYPGQANYSAFNDAADRLIPLAFAYAVTGDERFSDLTRQYLLEYATWEYWGGDIALGDRDLTLSFMLDGNALAYDWVYDQLSETDRTTIRAALARHAEEQYVAATSSYNSAWRNWWPASFAQNHWHINNTAIGMTALALEGEDSRTATWLDHVIGQMAINQAVLNSIHDGTWHEGVYYQNMMLTLSLPFLHNLQRLKGQELFADEYLQNYVLYKLYNYLPGTRQYALSFSSFFIEWGWNAGDHQNVLRFIARRYRSGYAAWLAQQIIATDRRYTTIYHAPHYVFEFFYYDPTVVPVAPTALPHDHTLPDLEGVIWRTGWGSDDVVFGLRTGPYGGRFLYEAYLDGTYPFDIAGAGLNVGHDQPDANTFYLYKGGTDLSSELPIREREQTTQLHNTLLVDGQDQYFAEGHGNIYEDTDARLEAVYETPGFNYLASDATDRYRQQNNDGPGSPGDWMIDEFTRYVLFAKPNYLVMVDNIRSATVHQYDWLCHAAEGGSITLEGDWIKGVANAEDVLGVKVLAPAGFTHTVETSTHPYTSHQKPRIHIRPASNVTDTHFVTVLYPTNDARWSSKPAMSLLADTSQAAGVRVEMDGTQDHLVKYGTAEDVTVGEYSLTGTVASISRATDGKLAGLFLGNGQMVSDGNGARVLIQSPGAITVEAVYSGTALALYGDDLHGLKIYGPEVDVDRVSVNDQQAIAAKIDDYIYVFSQATLVLRGTAAERATHLSWDVYGELPPATTWQIAYQGPTGDQSSPVTGILSPTRAYSLTGLTNYSWYTITLNAMVGAAPILTDTVYVRPPDQPAAVTVHNLQSTSNALAWIGVLAAAVLALFALSWLMCRRKQKHHQA